ncbi:hypothetical protein NQ315_014901 [Exocentrus adspersus]|uniref:Uncharacterized protein n=1 Tax=Exocentrus adspersus TaxID=1586481 RepID=A0AAV8VKZ4_9CUCU|nr:hypothetical protein NQ315_014901 [Exocentrus adspersus]
MDEDVRIPRNTEAIVTAHLEGKPDGLDIFLVEPDASRHEDALVAKCLVDGRRTVPVRVANLNVNRVTLKKGEAIRICEPVAKVTKLNPGLKSADHTTSPDVLQSFKKTWNHLSEEEMRKASRFMTPTKDRLREEQGHDKDLQLVRQWLDSGVRPKWQEISRHGPTVKGYWLRYYWINCRRSVE